MGSFSETQAWALTFKPGSLILEPGSLARKPGFLNRKRGSLKLKPWIYPQYMPILLLFGRGICFSLPQLARNSFRAWPLKFKPGLCFSLRAWPLKFKPVALKLKPGSLKLKPGALKLKPVSLKLKPGSLELKPTHSSSAPSPARKAGRVSFACFNQNLRFKPFLKPNSGRVITKTCSAFSLGK